jgi:hypothetical protein
VKPLSTLRARGAACVAVTFDRAAFALAGRNAEQKRRGLPPEEPDADEEQESAQQLRALGHALAEFDVKLHVVRPGRPLGELLVG